MYYIIGKQLYVCAIKAFGGEAMKNIKTIVKGTLKTNKEKTGCGECQTSCQSACKTSCTLANQRCENIKHR